MSRLFLDLRRVNGQAVAVFGKGGGSFSVPVEGVQPGDPRWVCGDSAGDRRASAVRKSSLREYLNRK